MIEYLLDNSLFYLIPEEIDHAVACTFKESKDNLILLESSDELKINSNDKAEVFVNSSEGIIYFISSVNNVQNSNLSIDIPQDYEILQRRENIRVDINEEILIRSNNFEKNVMLLDISAGGMKILADEQISLNVEYDAVFNFDNINLIYKFIPQRISSQKFLGHDMFQISGVIESKSPKDKIELVQYCYKKLYEKSYRK